MDGAVRSPLLSAAGWVVNHKRAQWIWQQEILKVLRSRQSVSRDPFPNGEKSYFLSKQARVTIEARRNRFNAVRPHARFGYCSLASARKQCEGYVVATLGYSCGARLAWRTIIVSYRASHRLAIRERKSDMAGTKSLGACSLWISARTFYVEEQGPARWTQRGRSAQS